MTGILRSAIMLIVGLATVALLLVACTATGSTTPPPSDCGNIPASIGGCSSGRPVYAGTTCDELAEEWATAVDRLVTATFSEPALIDGKQRSARIQDAMILASITAGMRLNDLGLLGTCKAEDFVATADPLFGDQFRAGIPSMLYDGAPTATWEQFLFDLRRAIKIIDVSPAASA